MFALAASFLIVVGAETFQIPAWNGVVRALEAKHADMETAVLVSAPEVTDCRVGMAELPHRYVAFVLRPEEARIETVQKLAAIMHALDDDIYEDAIWGVVTGPDPETALRMVSSDEPRTIERALSTTNIEPDLVPGRIASFSDGNPPGCWYVKDETGKVERFRQDGDLSADFAREWNRCDPNFILTSSHASELNLEMPFSRGNMVAQNGRFAMCPHETLIDYKTGHANLEAFDASLPTIPLEEPQAEKVWIAAGNCLIANNPGPQCMVMTALGWGKCNQFMGYMTTTWFGFMGWETLRNFATRRQTLGQAWFAAKVSLQRELRAPEQLDDFRRQGLAWDYYATVLYGDPARDCRLAQAPLAAWREGEPPLVVVLPERKRGWRLKKAPAGAEVELHDDFAFVVKYPALGPDWASEFEFE